MRRTKIGAGERRRFPPPWTVADKGACFIVRNHAGQPLAYVYYDHPQAGDLTWDEARRIAANIVKLPDLLGRPRTWGR